MKVQIISDVHLEQGGMVVPKTDADVLVLAGDISNSSVKSITWGAKWADALGIPVVQVLGNHEFWDGEKEMSWYSRDRHLANEDVKALRASGSDIHLLDASSVVICNVRFLGCTLWTDYRCPVADTYGLIENQRKAMTACSMGMPEHFYVNFEDPRRSTKPMITTTHLLAVHMQERKWLEAEIAKPFDGKTVVVTHHAPHPRSIHPKYTSSWLTPAFANVLPSQFFQADLWVHGHIHFQNEYQVGGCKVVCNPRGLFDEVPNFEPDLVVTI